MDASAVFCLIIYRVSTVQTTNQFLFMMTAAEDFFGMLIFISAFPSFGLDAWLRTNFITGNLSLREKAFELFISFLRGHVIEKNANITSNALKYTE